MNNQQQQTISEDVIKFLLKLKNNNIQNLKNALKKLGERTQGNKDQLLVRLANKLARPESRQLVRSNFRPEIYRQLYEVEINGNYSQLAQQMQQQMQGVMGPAEMQQVVQQQRPALPQQNMRYLNPNEMMQTNPYNGSNPMNFGQTALMQGSTSFSHQVNIKPPQINNAFPQSNGGAINFRANGGPIQQQQRPMGVPQTAADVIEIDSRENSPRNNGSVNMVSPIQHTLPPHQPKRSIFTDPVSSNGAVQMQSSDLQKLSYEQIMKSQGTPCMFDEQLSGQSNIYCFCEGYNSIYHQGSNQQQLHTLIRCQQCQRDQHLHCTENVSMRILAHSGGYICHQCQFTTLDPFAVPIMTILRPFKVAKLTSAQVRNRHGNPQVMAMVGKEFLVKESVFQDLSSYRFSKDSSVKVQVRCIRLDGVGFEHCWPKFGSVSVNGGAQAMEFRIPDPPNDQKKRKDDILDITANLKRGKNRIELVQEQKNHEGYYNHVGQICAIFLVKIVQPHDIVNYVRTFHIERPELSLKRALGFFKHGGNEASDIQEIETETAEQILIRLQCPITYTTIKTPARGDLCTHLQCFDIDSYIQSNHQHKRWKCPQCNRRAHTLIIDSYFQSLLDLMRKSEDFRNNDRLTLDKNLNVCVQVNDTTTAKYALIKEDAPKCEEVPSAENPQGESGIPMKGESPESAPKFSFKYDISMRELICIDGKQRQRGQRMATGEGSQEKAIDGGDGGQPPTTSSTSGDYSQGNNQQNVMRAGKKAEADICVIDSEDEAVAA